MFAESAWNFPFLQFEHHLFLKSDIFDRQALGAKFASGCPAVILGHAVCGRMGRLKTTPLNDVSKNLSFPLQLGLLVLFGRGIIKVRASIGHKLVVA